LYAEAGQPVAASSWEQNRCCIYRFFDRRKTANLRQMRPITDKAFSAETSFSLGDAGISTV
jgi:hypothetical protein